jgi:hypothetical protein
MTAPVDSGNGGEGISYRDQLPLHWLPLKALPDPAAAARIDESNIKLLSAAALLDESPKVSDEPTQGELELVRIHGKLNLLLELFGSLLRHQQVRPDAVPLRLSGRSVAWTASGAVPAVDDLVLIELYLKTTLPHPLRLPARIVAVTGGEVQAQLQAAGEASQSELERHVFLRHRREIAESRQMKRA